MLSVQTTGLVGLAVAENPHEVCHVSCAVFNGNCQGDQSFLLGICVRRYAVYLKAVPT